MSNRRYIQTEADNATVAEEANEVKAEESDAPDLVPPSSQERTRDEGCAVLKGVTGGNQQEQNDAPSNGHDARTNGPTAVAGPTLTPIRHTAQQPKAAAVNGIPNVIPISESKAPQQCRCNKKLTFARSDAEFALACLKYAREPLKIDFAAVAQEVSMSKGGCQNKYRLLMRRFEASKEGVKHQIAQPPPPPQQNEVATADSTATAGAPKTTVIKLE